MDYRLKAAFSAITVCLGLFLAPLCCVATTYYISPTGSDSANGLTSSTAWLTPNHSVNCGDVIYALPGSYNWGHFSNADWGAVSCGAGGHFMVPVVCQTFLTCVNDITSAPFYANGFYMDKSHWGLMGWLIKGSNTQEACVTTYPLSNGQVSDILIADNVMMGCGWGGITVDSNAGVGGDYVVAIANVIAYTTGVSNFCNSAIDIVQPIASDSSPGTHFYISGNFLMYNVNGNPCGGTAATDGEGIIFDSFNNNSYVQQAVMDNNIAIDNGGRGFLVFDSATAPIYMRHNTAVWNNTQTGQRNLGDCGEIQIDRASYVTAMWNLAETNAPVAGCDSNTVFAILTTTGDATDQAYWNLAYDLLGNSDGIINSPGFTYANTNIFGVNPALVAPYNPPSPNCSGYTSTIACMGQLIASVRSASYPEVGYQTPTTNMVYDPLFPQWLCQYSSLLNGLVTMGCSVGSTVINSGAAINSGVLVN